MPAECRFAPGLLGTNGADASGFSGAKHPNGGTGCRLRDIGGVANKRFRVDVRSLKDQANQPLVRDSTVAYRHQLSAFAAFLVALIPPLSAVSAVRSRPT
jgi:hypothetical protein